MSAGLLAALAAALLYLNARDLARSSTADANGLDNTPPVSSWLPLAGLRLRFWLSAPPGTRITSAHRSPDLDAAVSWSTSAGAGAHTRAEALDVNHPTLSLDELGAAMAASGMWRVVLIERSRNHVHCAI